jgi:CheY-like chemotaxis protein
VTTNGPTVKAAAQHKRVLVVDDNEMNGSYIRTVLMKHPFSIEVVNDGQAALDAIQRHRPDLVLLDVMMPGLSGLDVLETLRDDPAFTSIPVILVTAKSQDEDLLNGYQTGADYFISKPFTPRQLLHGIGLVLGMRLLD